MSLIKLKMFDDVKLTFDVVLWNIISDTCFEFWKFSDLWFNKFKNKLY